MLHHLFPPVAWPILPLTLQLADARAEYRFHTPSRNIYCLMTADSVSCDVKAHGWDLWGCADSGCYGHRFRLPAHGKAHARRSSDTMVGFTTTSLGYGFRITVGQLSCLSQQHGLTCTNPSGGRMHLDREAYVLE